MAKKPKLPATGTTATRRVNVIYSLRRASRTTATVKTYTKRKPTKRVDKIEAWGVFRKKECLAVRFSEEEANDIRWKCETVEPVTIIRTRKVINGK